MYVLPNVGVQYEPPCWMSLLSFSPVWMSLLPPPRPAPYVPSPPPPEVSSGVYYILSHCSSCFLGVQSQAQVLNLFIYLQRKLYAEPFRSCVVFVFDQFVNLLFSSIPPQEGNPVKAGWGRGGGGQRGTPGYMCYIGVCLFHVNS